MKLAPISIAAALALAACAGTQDAPPPSKKAKAPPPPPAANYANPRASGRMPCSLGRPTYSRSCAWTVLRKDQAHGTLRITKPDGRVRVLAFQRGEFTSGQARLQYRKDGGFWLVNVNDREFYRFAEEVFTGG